jgi:hypothetical protein
MDDSKDGGSFSVAPPPVDGLGNYKGVMLCNRPVEESHPSRMRNAADAGCPPFKSTIAPCEREQLGLQPAKKLEARSVVKTRGPSAALRRHMQWIKELQVQVADEHAIIADDETQQSERKQKMQVLFKEQRDAIKELKSKGLNTSSDVRKLETHLMKTGGVKGQSKASGKKPLWAMTEEEKEAAETEEAAALIDFAENLDFDKYVVDAEFRQCLQVVQDRAKKLQQEQDRFKDDLIRDFNANAEDDGDEFGSAYTGSQADEGSQLGDLPGRTGPARRRYGAPGDDRRDWDSSTAMGDDYAESIGRESRSDAGRVMEAMPQLKGIHSEKSVQRIIEKARQGTPSEA